MVSKEDHVVFWDMKGFITIDFVEKAANVSYASYSYLHGRILSMKIAIRSIAYLLNEHHIKKYA